MDDNIAKMHNFMQLADVEMPKMRLDADKARKRAVRAAFHQQAAVLNQFRLYKKKDVWMALKNYMVLRKQRRHRTVNMLNIFRRQHMYCKLRIWRRKTWEARQLSKEDCLNGADLRLKAFSDRLDQFR